jgi:hypothetical protein
MAWLHPMNLDAGTDWLKRNNNADDRAFMTGRDSGSRC